jgi:transposase
MRRLQIADAQVMSLAIRQEIGRSQDSRYDHRLHGVLLVSQGMSCYEVAEYFGDHPRTVERWVKRFERKGFAGLQEEERTGRPMRLDQDQWTSLGQDLRRSPRDFGYTQNFWDGKLLSHHLKAVYGVTLGTRQCQRIFHRLEFRHRKPRGLIAQADPEAKEAFKKTSPTGPRPGD